jgi:hypothetical protein
VGASKDLWVTLQNPLFGGPIDSNPVNDYVRKVSFTAGFQSPWGASLRWQPARLSVTLDNGDRRFDPLWTGGPWYSAAGYRYGVGAGIVLSENANTTNLFYGRVTDWPLQPSRQAASTITLIAADVSEQLARTVLTPQPLSPVQTIEQRLNALCDLAGLPAIARFFQSEPGVTLAPTDYAGNVWQSMQLAADSAGGTLQVGQFGWVFYFNRAYPSSVTVTATLASDAAAARPTVDVTLSSGQDTIVNEVSRQRVGGAVQVRRDPISITKFGVRSNVRTDLVCLSDVTVDEIAIQALAVSPAPTPEIVEMSLHSAAGTGTAPTLLPGARVSISEQFYSAAGALMYTITQESFIRTTELSATRTGTNAGSAMFDVRWTHGVQNAAAWTVLTLGSNTAGLLDANVLAYTYGTEFTGRKVWFDTAQVTPAEANSLERRGIHTFPNSVARDAAYATNAPSVGEAVQLLDSFRVEQWDGVSWTGLWN